MKRRLRKKLRRGEFAEYGFGIQLDFVPGLTPDDIERIVDRIIAVVEPRGMYVGGGGSAKGFGGYITKRKASCTEEDRLYVSSSLQGTSGVSKCTVEDLTDSWHGTF